MKNRKQIAKYVKVSLRFGYSQFLLYLCICFTAFNNLEMVSSVVYMNFAELLQYHLPTHIFLAYGSKTEHRGFHRSWHQ